MQVSNSFLSVALSEYVMSNAIQVDEWMLQWGLPNVFSSLQSLSNLPTLATAALYDVRGRQGEKLSVLKKNEANFSNTP